VVLNFISVTHWCYLLEFLLASRLPRGPARSATWPSTWA